MLVLTEPWGVCLFFLPYSHIRLGCARGRLFVIAHAGVGPLSSKGPRVIVSADVSILPQSVFVRGGATGAALKAGVGPLSGKGPRVIVSADVSILPQSVFVREGATGAALKVKLIVSTKTVSLYGLSRVMGLDHLVDWAGERAMISICISLPQWLRAHCVEGCQKRLYGALNRETFIAVVNANSHDDIRTLAAAAAIETIF
ncbi:hypothetical protein Tco_0677779 [Tanacetum coccineum]|uniref:Uncharacterized protein n=1 Tax=Tanacetum coccineum TaxID=301880 RepID=A0ABQ4XDW8_9ASTR